MQGVVEGYPSLFGTVGEANDMVMHGPFLSSLRTRGLRRIPLLFQHEPSEMTGIWLKLKEDWRGLYAAAG